jgi:hypothetical protein
VCERHSDDLCKRASGRFAATFYFTAKLLGGDGCKTPRKCRKNRNGNFCGWLSCAPVDCQGSETSTPGGRAANRASTQSGGKGRCESNVRKKSMAYARKLNQGGGMFYLP